MPTLMTLKAERSLFVFICCFQVFYMYAKLQTCKTEFLIQFLVFDSNVKLLLDMRSTKGINRGRQEPTRGNW